MSEVRGILCDIDGVLHVSMQPVAGAAEALHSLEQQGYEICFVTNTTTQSRANLTQSLQSIGLPVSETRLVTAPVATANYIRQHYPDQRCWLLSKGDTASDFAGIELVPLETEDAGVVVIGGAEELLTYEHMNRAFRMLMNGAALLAMHTNLYWRTSSGLQLDSGPYVRALELASGKQAVVLGKPERAFFEQARRVIGVQASQAIMVGDDLQNDIQGAQQAGMRGIFVTTGKHQANSPLLASIRPDAVLASVADLPEYLARAVKRLM